MTTLFPAATRLDAWLQATEHLLGVESDLNVILAISGPSHDGPASKAARSLADEFFRAEGTEPLHTVAETIFPGWAYKKKGLAGMIVDYEDAYSILRNADRRRWGTYAHRILFRRDADGNVAQPLVALINKMKDELSQENRGAYKSCYELGIAEGEYDLPLYNVIDDQSRRRGGPCLSHLSFKLFNGCVHLTAVYRSHDYRYKVLGNLLGLARLQACVAEQVGIPMGTLVVHSTYAFVDLAQGKSRLRKLIADIREASEEKSHALAN